MLIRIYECKLLMQLKLDYFQLLEINILKSDKSMINFKSLIKIKRWYYE